MKFKNEYTGGLKDPCCAFCGEPRAVLPGDETLTAFAGRYGRRLGALCLDCSGLGADAMRRLLAGRAADLELEAHGRAGFGCPSMIRVPLAELLREAAAEKFKRLPRLIPPVRRVEQLGLWELRP
jgi:hypothetical protein